MKKEKKNLSHTLTPENPPSLVRSNLMSIKGYAPYCGGWGLVSAGTAQNKKDCGSPRTIFNGKQFECKTCGWTTSFEKKFIDLYKEKWADI